MSATALNPTILADSFVAREKKESVCIHVLYIFSHSVWNICIDIKTDKKEKDGLHS